MKTPARLAFALALGSASAGASAGLLLNGNFETDVLPAGTSVTYPHGSSGLTGWTVTGTDVQLVGANFQTLTGSGGVGQWVDLTGSNEGYFKGLTSNAFSTVVGQQYALSFDLGVLTTQAYGPASVSVSVNGVSLGDRTNAPVINGSFAMSWANQTVNFVATGTSTVVGIIGRDGPLSNPNVIGLDNVAIAAVPEPHEWAMMLAGLGLVGWAARRRRDGQDGAQMAMA